MAVTGTGPVQDPYKDFWPSQWFQTTKLLVSAQHAAFSRLDCFVSSSGRRPWRTRAVLAASRQRTTALNGTCFAYFCFTKACCTIGRFFWWNRQWPGRWTLLLLLYIDGCRWFQVPAWRRGTSMVQQLWSWPWSLDRQDIADLHWFTHFHSFLVCSHALAFHMAWMVILSVHGVSHWNVWYKLRLRLVLKERWEWHGMTRSYFRKPTRLELMAHGTPSLYWVLQVEVIRLLTEAGAEMERPTGGRFQRGLAHSVGWLLEVSMKLGYVS